MERTHTRRLDPKYTVESATPLIVRTASGKELPADEPLFILRAQDRLALDALINYFNLCVAHNCGQEQLAGIATMIGQFTGFAAAHPERMKLPDAAPKGGNA